MTNVELEPARTARGRSLALSALALALALVVLDGTLVGAALPVIIGKLHLNFAQAQWVNGVYAIVFAALLITGERLGHRYGRRTIIAAGLVLLMLGSVLAAVAHAPSTLIWGRIVQGVAAAAILPGVYSIANARYRRRRAGAGALLVAVAVAGPLLGGWLSTSFGWTWVFLVNVPVGLIALVLLILWVPDITGRDEALDLDVDGFLLGGAGFGLVMFGLIQGPTFGWWRPLRDFPILGLTWSTRATMSPTPVLLVVGLLLCLLFVLWERHRLRARRPALVDPNLLRLPGFRWGALVTLLIAITNFGLLFVLPLYLVNVLNMTTLRAGAVLSAAALGALVAARWSDAVARWCGAVRTVRLGLTIDVIAVAVLGLVLSTRLSGWWVAVLLLCYGFGLGLVGARLPRIVLSKVPPGQGGPAGATQSTALQIGAALGTAVLGGALSIALSKDLSHRLDLIHMPRVTGTRLAEATRDSAGIAIPDLRRHGGADAIVSALSHAFTDATRTSLLTGAIVLLIGLLAAARIPAPTWEFRPVRRGLAAAGQVVAGGAAAKSPAETSEGEGTTEADVVAVTETEIAASETATADTATATVIEETASPEAATAVPGLTETVAAETVTSDNGTTEDAVAESSEDADESAVDTVQTVGRHAAAEPVETDSGDIESASEAPSGASETAPESEREAKDSGAES
ncbi:MFS transporter [Nocardia aurantia]|uniref:Putative multidrug resistance protein MdtD n=1 Tax=Nocardia aurantia TaxID=2585199 RepID=A0A7K0DXX5_9NOCA|nr:MFS transporter [Nocardia aurantia]MQY29704.1 putative multidrug resistance protein MdtD [Nocardia aurantia]